MGTERYSKPVLLSRGVLNDGRGRPQRRATITLKF